MKIAYLGMPGSYSEMASLAYVADHPGIVAAQTDIIPYNQFEDIIQATANQSIDFGMLPAENSTTGLISRSTDLLRQQPVTIIDEVYQRVSHSLWASAGADLSSLHTVYSHAEALSQCQGFLSQYPNIEQVEYSSTAQATSLVAQSQDPGQAAIASQRAGELAGLQSLADDIQDEANNATRFYVIRHEKHAKQAGNRLVLSVHTRHEAGALSKVLQVFDILDCNLELLTARPIPGRAFAYSFFIEVDIANIADNIELLLGMLDHVTLDHQVLGRYYPTKFPFSQKEDSYD